MQLQNRDDNMTIQFLQPTIALVHWYWQMRGVLNAEGTEKPAYQGIFSWMIEKQNDQWRVRASQNTIIANT